MLAPRDKSFIEDIVDGFCYGGVDKFLEELLKASCDPGFARSI